MDGMQRKQSDALPSMNYSAFEQVKREGTHFHQRHPTIPGRTLSLAPPVSPTTMYAGPPPVPFNNTSNAVVGLGGMPSPPNSRRTSKEDEEQGAPPRLPSLSEAGLSDPFAQPSHAPHSSAQPSGPPIKAEAYSKPEPPPFGLNERGHYGSTPHICGHDQPQPLQRHPHSLSVGSASAAHASPSSHYQPNPLHSAGSYTSQPSSASSYGNSFAPPRSSVDSQYSAADRSYSLPNSHDPGQSPRSHSFSRQVPDHGDQISQTLTLATIKRDLNSIMEHSNALFRFSEQFFKHSTQTQDHPYSVQLEALSPLMPQFNDQLNNAQNILDSLRRWQDSVRSNQRARALSEQLSSRPFAKPPSDYDCREEPNGHPYIDEKSARLAPPPDLKKQRRGAGRAAPPGRCHSCNRAETPEWRRGPDGARTLCNACGLHYAKLTRKMNQQNQMNGLSRPGNGHPSTPGDSGASSTMSQ